MIKDRTIEFAKGHMGGNEIVLVDGDSIPKGRELETELALLDPPNIRGHQGVLLHKLDGNRVRAEIISVSSRGYISSCGGLTQVLGKVLLETDFMHKFQMRLDEPVAEVELETDVGVFEIIIENHEHKADKIYSVMNPFVNECYELGVEKTQACGVDVTKVGNVLVVNGDDLRKVYPTISLNNIDAKTTKALIEVQQTFLANEFRGQVGGYFSLYDLHPDHKGDGRVIFPHNIYAGHIEPSCGTGTVAVGIAILENQSLQVHGNNIELRFESGGSDLRIGGPDTTTLELTVADNSAITDARFTHDLVEIVATGRVWI